MTKRERSYGSACDPLVNNAGQTQCFNSLTCFSSLRITRNPCGSTVGQGGWPAGSQKKKNLCVDLAMTMQVELKKISFHFPFIFIHSNATTMFIVQIFMN